MTLSEKNKYIYSILNICNNTLFGVSRRLKAYTPSSLLAPETYFYEVLWAARLTYNKTLHSPLLNSRARDSFSWAPDLPVPRLGAVSVGHPVIYVILD